MSENNPFYPLFLNLSGKSCTVVGGGRVALRKVNSLIKHGAKVTVISPRLISGMQKLADRGKIKVLPRPYKTGDLGSAYLAIIATSDIKINQAAASEARQRGILVNVVDDPGLSDFIVPSAVNRGNLTIAVSTAGDSPALARRIRHKLEREFGPEYKLLTKLIAQVRASIHKQHIKVSSNDWQEALDIDRLASLVKDGNMKEARDMLLKKLLESKRKKVQ